MNDMTHTTAPLRATARLRLALRANATFSIVTGATALIAGSWVSRELGIDHVALTRVVGAGLIGFALGVLVLARREEETLRRESLLISIADFGWVLGTAVVVTTGVLTSTGNLVAVLVALVVADFGATQLWFRSRATAPAHRLHSAPA